MISEEMRRAGADKLQELLEHGTVSYEFIADAVYMAMVTTRGPPCVYESRPFYVAGQLTGGYISGVASGYSHEGTWCKTHGWKCPDLTRQPNSL